MYALVFTTDCTGYQWIYCFKTEDNILKATKKWYTGYSDIAELREMHNLLVLVLDNAVKHRSLEIIEFFETRGIRS